MTAENADNVLLPIHGRKLGIIGDGESTTTSALVLDGTVIASTRLTAPFIMTVIGGAAAAGGIAVTGAQAGDNVVGAMQMNGAPTNASSLFESTISVSGFIQQTSNVNLAGDSYLIIVFPRS
jgi:hypothetical protein